MESVVIDKIDTKAMEMALIEGQTPFALFKPAKGIPVLVKVSPTGTHKNVTNFPIFNRKTKNFANYFSYLHSYLFTRELLDLDTCHRGRFTHGGQDEPKSDDYRWSRQD